MKKTFLLILSAYTLLSASPLIKTAKDAGLKAIPNSKAELLKLIDNKNNPITKEKVALGYKLFMDPRLSQSGVISCNFCHNLGLGGVDGVEAAIGHKWAKNPHNLNSPTVYNAVFASSQFWDGRDKDLEAQAQGPIQAPPEMAATKEHVLAVVNSIPEYKNSFNKIYSDQKISFKRVADVIAVFERTLVTPSRFDKFLNGDDKALKTKEKLGLKTFIDKGCVSCHNSYALGGEMQGFALIAPYKYASKGDFKGDKNGLVKVPTLRNITKTAPYFHNGAIKTLDEAIAEMGRIQLGITLNKNEVSNIKTFLKSLDGDIPKLDVVELPASSATTPLPNN